MLQFSTYGVNNVTPKSFDHNKSDEIYGHNCLCVTVKTFNAWILCHRVLCLNNMIAVSKESRLLLRVNKSHAWSQKITNILFNCNYINQKATRFSAAESLTYDLHEATTVTILYLWSITCESLPFANQEHHLDTFSTREFDRSANQSVLDTTKRFFFSRSARAIKQANASLKAAIGRLHSRFVSATSSFEVRAEKMSRTGRDTWPRDGCVQNLPYGRANIIRTTVVEVAEWLDMSRLALWLFQPRARAHRRGREDN